jgi:biotin operon repressor
MNGRGRPEVLASTEVLEVLLDEEWHTANDLAEQFGVIAPTVRNKIRELRSAGWPIMPGAKGLKLIDDTRIDDNVADEWRYMVSWAKGTLEGLATVAEPMNKPKLIRALRQALPADRVTRKQLRSASVTLTRLIEAAYIEGEEDE